MTTISFRRTKSPTWLGNGLGTSPGEYAVVQDGVDVATISGGFRWRAFKDDQPWLQADRFDDLKAKIVSTLTAATASVC